MRAERQSAQAAGPRRTEKRRGLWDSGRGHDSGDGRRSREGERGWEGEDSAATTHYPAPTAQLRLCLRSLLRCALSPSCPLSTQPPSTAPALLSRDRLPPFNPQPSATPKHPPPDSHLPHVLFASAEMSTAFAFPSTSQWATHESSSTSPLPPLSCAHGLSLLRRQVGCTSPAASRLLLQDFDRCHTAALQALLQRLRPLPGLPPASRLSSLASPLLELCRALPPLRQSALGAARRSAAAPPAVRASPGGAQAACGRPLARGLPGGSQRSGAVEHPAALAVLRPLHRRPRSAERLPRPHLPRGVRHLPGAQRDGGRAADGRRGAAERQRGAAARDRRAAAAPAAPAAPAEGPAAAAAATGPTARMAALRAIQAALQSGGGLGGVWRFSGAAGRSAAERPRGAELRRLCIDRRPLL